MKEIEELKKYEIFGKPLFYFWYKDGNLNGFNVRPDICEFTEKNHELIWNSGWVNHFLDPNYEITQEFVKEFIENKLPKLIEFVNNYYQEYNLNFKVERQ